MRDEPPGSQTRPVGDRPTVVTYDGEIISAAALEARILQISDDLEAQIDVLLARAEEASAARANYMKAMAKSRLHARTMPGHGPGGRTTNDEAQDHAIDENGELLVAHLTTEAVYEATRDASFARRAQLEALRSINANVRAVST